MDQIEARMRVEKPASDEHTLVYVTGNEVKFKVALQALAGSRITLERISLHLPEIQSSSVEEIAGWSAEWAGRELNRPVVVMDAGYYIESLNGFPGPFIKYVNDWFSAGDYLNLLQGKTDRRVTVRYCLAYCQPREKPVLFCQAQYGEIAHQCGKPAGSSIDQVFIPDGFSKPVSEIPAEELIAYWGQAEAWQKLKQHLESEP